MSDLPRAFRLGLYARRHGKPITDNPYKVRSHRVSWDYGWKSDGPAPDDDADRDPRELLADQRRSDAWNAWRDAKRRCLPWDDELAERERVWRARDREWQAIMMERRTAALPPGDWEMTEAEYVAFLEKRYDDQSARAEFFRRCDFPECMSEDMWRTAAATFEDLQAARGNRPGP
jgi:hypothetical protein